MINNNIPNNRKIKEKKRNKEDYSSNFFIVNKKTIFVLMKI